jgi:Tfp pilus assembly protein PilV
MERFIGRRRVARVLAGRQADEAGFSIIEFILAMTLLLVVIVATSMAFTGSVRVSANVRQRVAATNLATMTMERLRASSNNASTFGNIPITTTTTNSPVLDGTIFAITQTVEWENVGYAGTACQAGLNRGLLLRATVSVGWPNSATTVQSSTLLAPPLGAYSASAGSIGIQVFDSTGRGNNNVTVTANTPGSPPTPLGTPGSVITTGIDGCAFFTSLPPGPYTFSLVQNSPPGVDSQEQHISWTPNIAAVAGTTVENPAIGYADAATIQYVFVPCTLVPTGACPASGPAVATGMSVSGANTTLTNSFYPFLTGAGPLYGLNPVYPFPSGYSLFAGDCSDSNPIGKDSTLTAFYSGTSAAPAPAVVSVAPNLTTPGATVPLYPLNITVQSSGGSAVSNPGNPTPMTAISNPSVTAHGGNCPYGSPTYTLANGNGSGISTTGVGLGHLTITARGQVGGSPRTSLPVNIWVMPDGVYTVDATGAKVALVYPFSAPTTLVIRLQ